MSFRVRRSFTRARPLPRQLCSASPCTRQSLSARRRDSSLVAHFRRTLASRLDRAASNRIKGTVTYKKRIQVASTR